MVKKIDEEPLMRLSELARLGRLALGIQNKFGDYI